jgi:hypothetical protein
MSSTEQNTEKKKNRFPHMQPFNISKKQPNRKRNAWYRKGS